MGVPALFRWLSNKYPRIVSTVEEEHPHDVNGVVVPVDISKPNPNAVEFDNLYLDMNGIIHPCCHPEGRPAPETEDDMMVSVFEYTERIVNMVRPRQLLYMAIDGVAPRAKMNQQRTRRFRAAQEAKILVQKEESIRKDLKKRGLAKPGEFSTEPKKAFDSNCITPGTPFMSNLAAALRYFVAQKLNTDQGWKNVKVIISDASVPGEGEHKIMDYIRGQRSQPGYNPNTVHVLYGLDADLIMLALATHEPHFYVLREDVFFQEQAKRGLCYNCGEAGHESRDCMVLPGQAKQKPKQEVAVKPYVFLHVSVLREYLDFELRRENMSFPFDLERGIDDWVFLCFFVGNDFLPHLPSLDIREGAIDTLVEIYKRNLPLMGGYLTNGGTVDLGRAEIIMAELGQQEEEVFRRRKEKEERQEEARRRRTQAGRENRAKRRRVEGAELSSEVYADREGPTDAVPPKKVKGPERPPEMELFAVGSTDAETLAADNRRLVERLPDIRMANLSAAEKLRMEIRRRRTAGFSGSTAENPGVSVTEGAKADSRADDREPADTVVPDQEDSGTAQATNHRSKQATTGAQVHALPSDNQSAIAGHVPHKRTIEEVEEEDAAADEVITKEDDDNVEDIAQEADADVDLVKKSFEVEEMEKEKPPTDEVRLWEPGFKERYYRSKFGIELNDVAFRRSIVRSYVEGLCWVLKYYYQGCPSWKWFYEYHYSPFASDFVNVNEFEVNFDLGKPFKPFEQLMGVLPAASRSHIPPAFQNLMTDADSPIIDFYPEDFKIDLNGKKHAWQAVALLPWIEEKRLLDSLQNDYPKLTEEEVMRNTRGSDVLYISESHPAYEELCSLYGKKKSSEPVRINPKTTGQMSGTVLPDPTCVPRTTYRSPLLEKGMQDLVNDRSLSVLFRNPELPTGQQFRATLLKGVVMPKKILTSEDAFHVQFGGAGRRGRGRGRSNMGVVSRLVRGSSYNISQATPSPNRHQNMQSRSTPGSGDRRSPYYGYYNSPAYSSSGYDTSPAAYSGYSNSPASYASSPVNYSPAAYTNSAAYAASRSSYGSSPAGGFSTSYGRSDTAYGQAPTGYCASPSRYGGVSVSHSNYHGGYARSDGYGGFPASYDSGSMYSEPSAGFTLPAGYGHPPGGHPVQSRPPPDQRHWGGQQNPQPPPYRQQQYSQAPQKPPPGGNLGWSRNVRR